MRPAAWRRSASDKDDSPRKLPAGLGRPACAAPASTCRARPASANTASSPRIFLGNGAAASGPVSIAREFAMSFSLFPESRFEACVARYSQVLGHDIKIPEQPHTTAHNLACLKHSRPALRRTARMSLALSLMPWEQVILPVLVRPHTTHTRIWNPRSIGAARRACSLLRARAADT